jgi:Zn-dependent protease
MDELTAVQRICVWILPVIFAITLHEVAHGLVAKWLGDNTAARLGRLSLNPLHHIDLVGTIIVPGVLLLLGGFLFGWAKPVPVDFDRLRNPKRDMVLVAIAGPLANLLMAIAWALTLRIAGSLELDYIQKPLELMSVAGIVINAVLMVLNLLPLPPLDGGRIVAGLLPHHLAEPYSRLEPYGFYILLALMATGTLSTLMDGPLELVQGFVFSLAGH